MSIFENTDFTVSNDIALFSYFGSRDFSKLQSDVKAAVAERADKAMDFELVPLTAGLYMEFAENGNRTHFEDIYHKRRSVLMDLLSGALVTASEKYTRKIIDLVWAITEETTWVVPAHNVSADGIYHGKPLSEEYKAEAPEIDLLSAATAALLAFVYKYLGASLDKLTGGVMSERIVFELRKRIISPYLKREMRWTVNFINNWVPWIVSNVLTVAAITESDKSALRDFINRSVEYLTRFTDTYGEDGGCNEGVGYWGVAIGTLFDSCELIGDLTGRSCAALSSQFMKRASEFVYDMNVSLDKGYYVNFSDCGRKNFYDGRFLRRMGRRVGNDRLADFGSALFKNAYSDTVSRPVSYFTPYRTLSDLLDSELPEDISFSHCEGIKLYPNLRVAIMRSGDYFCAVKGGHNRESHNHNDIGNFIIYYKSEPVIIDIGNDTYTKNTFNENRYTLREMQSSFHNLPDFGGIMQSPGRDFHDNGFTRIESGLGVSVDYTGAYPAEAGVGFCRREVSLCADSIQIVDKWDAKNAVFHLMTADKPEISGNAAVLGNSMIVFESPVKINVEIFDISGSGILKRGWDREALWRLIIKPEANELIYSVRGID